MVSSCDTHRGGRAALPGSGCGRGVGPGVPVLGRQPFAAAQGGGGSVGQQGVDLSKVGVVNTATPGLLGYAIADRAAAVQLWEPAYTTLLSKKPEMRTLDLEIAKRWKVATGTTNIPYLGVAAHQAWIDRNPTLVPKLYQTYKDAADALTADPVAAARLILPNGSDDDRKAIVDLVRSNERLGLNLRWASDVRKEIEQVYAAGASTGFLPSMPSSATIYGAK